MAVTLKVWRGGRITLPADLREKYGIRQGDTLQLIDLQGIFVLTSAPTMVPELARQIEQARLQAGLNTEDLLNALGEQRERYYAERFS